jgi:hypothetical protein
MAFVKKSTKTHFPIIGDVFGVRSARCVLEFESGFATIWVIRFGCLHSDQDPHVCLAHDPTSVFSDFFFLKVMERKRETGEK